MMVFGICGKKGCSKSFEKATSVIQYVSGLMIPEDSGGGFGPGPMLPERLKAVFQVVDANSLYCRCGGQLLGTADQPPLASCPKCHRPYVEADLAGISNPDFKRSSAQQLNAVERFCNKVAAEMLVPKSAFERLWSPSETKDSNIYRLARHYRVSPVVVLRQALELRRLSQREYWTRFQSQRGKFTRTRRSAKKKGGDFYRTLRTRSSPRLLGTVLDAIQQRRIALLDAASVLGVKVTTLQTVIGGAG